MKVAVVIPVFKKSPDTEELLSLEYLRNNLPKHDKHFIAPKGLRVDMYSLRNAKTHYFSENYFQSRDSYNKLLLQQIFYERFKGYDFILIYQLDALVFSDKLLYWCKKNYSYIAAPWFNSLIAKLSYAKNSPISGGNGGFSLRSVPKSLEVLEAVSKASNRRTNNSFVQKLWFLKAVLSGQAHQKWLNAPADNYPFNEDGFWAIEAPKYSSSYKVAPFKEAVKFAFEKNPEKCFLINHGKLPFGTHAWRKYGNGFWSELLGLS